MNKPRVKSEIKNIIKIADLFLSDKFSINKVSNDSDYQEHSYTPEVILANIKDNAESALKALNEYE